MTNKHVAQLIKEYDAGRRDGAFQLMIYTAICQFVARGTSSESEDIEDAEFKGEEELKNGVEWLRRKMNAHHLNEA